MGKNLGSHALPVHSPVSLEVMMKAMKAMKRVTVLAKAAAPKAMKAMKRVNVIAKKAAAPKAMKAMKRVNIRGPEGHEGDEAREHPCQGRGGAEGDEGNEVSWRMSTLVRLGSLVIVPAPMCGCLRTVVERGC